ncbi:WHG domain-containing protein [Glaciihabitans sp. UYNi722]|uniref:TetR/AcrR family transcriptional regulator n=1 Tax=Glaciihabitans sp. UYNi722 TaxID=3156344 RepID=UPI003390D2AB
MARARLTPKSIITAAADLADLSGFDAISLSAVARQLGVQTASLYSHVRDRAAVLDGVHELALDELAEQIATAVAGRAGHEALVGLADAQRAYARRWPGRWEALQRPAASSTVQSEAAARVVTLTFAVLRGYALPDDELVHVTRMLGASVNGFITLERAGNFAHREPDTEASWQRILTALDALFRAWPTPSE